MEHIFSIFVLQYYGAHLLNFSSTILWSTSFQFLFYNNLQQPCLHSLKEDHSAGILRYELSVDTLYVK